MRHNLPCNPPWRSEPTIIEVSSEKEARHVDASNTVQSVHLNKSSQQSVPAPPLYTSYVPPARRQLVTDSPMVTHLIVPYMETSDQFLREYPPISLERDINMLPHSPADLGLYLKRMSMFNRLSWSNIIIQQDHHLIGMNIGLFRLEYLHMRSIIDHGQKSYHQ